ncbi:MAG TPA: cytidylate kinase family protein [Candidatus Binatia bacterium]|nr:cytidylate kinase family protein [Candidatus Binatia bacterium]
MPIITVYKGAFTAGEEIAKGVAQALGYRCVSREALLEASRSYGISEAKLNEVIDKDPHWWERWLENLQPYRVVLQAAMCKVAEEGDLVYHGHIGHELFPGIRHVLKVMLTAPTEFRIQQVQAQQRLDEAEARRYIDQVDEARTRRLMALFGTDWRDITRYDLALNVAELGVEGATRLIVEAARLERYQLTHASEEDFRNLTLASRVEAALVTSAKFRNLGISVRAEKGEVQLSGVFSHLVAEEEMVKLAKGVPGVSRVMTDITVLPVDLSDRY